MYDLAALKLETPVTTSSGRIEQIVIANLTEPSTTANCSISGWGLNACKSEDEMYNSGRMKMLHITSPKECVRKSSENVVSV